MKTIILTILFIMVSIASMFGQTETGHFRYETEGNYILIKLKNTPNTILTREIAVIDRPKSSYEALNKAIIQPFQKLINEGVFTKERMKELEAKETIRIDILYDETGNIFDLYFVIRSDKKTLLTENELYQICLKYIGGKIDTTGYRGWIGETKSIVEKYYVDEDFLIPFKDLKY